MELVAEIKTFPSLLLRADIANLIINNTTSDGF